MIALFQSLLNTPATQAALASLPVVAPGFGADLDCTLRGIVAIVGGLLVDTIGAKR